MIDTTYNFPHLSKAPIIEAVIEIKVSPEKQLEENNLLNELKNQLPEYSNTQPLRSYEHKLTIAPNKPPQQNITDLGFKGVKCISSDNHRIAVFGTEKYSFSLLRPYTNWAQFSNEALELWNVYKRFRDTTSIIRVGVRFINKIPLPPGERNFEVYLQSPPAAPHNLNLPFISFFYQDDLIIPDTIYGINFIRTIEPQQHKDILQLNLILDTDVYTNTGIDDGETLIKSLDEMRFYKNKIFFSSITENTLEMIK